MNIQNKKRANFDMAPDMIIVTGRHGYNRAMNGAYHKGEFEHEGRVYYKNVTNDFVIRWYSKKRQWLFDWRGLNNDNVCAAAGTQNVPYPSLMTRIWNVYDGKLKKWIKDETIQVKAFSTAHSPLRDHQVDATEWEDVDEDPIPQPDNEINVIKQQKNFIEDVVLEDESVLDIEALLLQGKEKLNKEPSHVFNLKENEEEDEIKKEVLNEINSLLKEETLKEMNFSSSTHSRQSKKHRESVDSVDLMLQELGEEEDSDDGVMDEFTKNLLANIENEAEDLNFSDEEDIDIDSILANSNYI